MSNRYDLNRGTIHRAYAEDIDPTLDPGSVRLVISDGAYGMKKAAWDMVSMDDLPAWYAPHIEAWGRVCMPSASVYLWNTAEGWARLDPVMRAAGWVFRCLIVWDKCTPPSMLGWKQIGTWPDQIEVAGFYQRGDSVFSLDECMGNVWKYSIAKLSRELIRTGRKIAHRGSAGDVMEALHVSQKPITFSDRMIRASSKPGELVLECFGGTCRVAVACERMPEPEARCYVCIEPDEDGRDYIAAVLPSLRLEFTEEESNGQRSLFT